MKPTKSRVYCRDSGRQKMLFETEKKANTFIKFNSEEIELEAGYSPIRSYYCISCNGWHVTSKKEPITMKSKTEIVLERYRHDKEQRAILKAKAAEIRKANTETLNKKLELVENQIKILEAAQESGDKINCFEIVTNALSELETAKSLVGSNKRKKNAEEKLLYLKKNIEMISKQKFTSAN